MTEVKPGDTVRLHYKGTLDDGTVFDSSEGRDPLEFVVGSGQIIPGLDKALPGMKVGDKKTVTAEAAEAYGPINPGQFQAVDRSDWPDNIPLEEGLPLQVQAQDGQTLNVTIHEVREDDVVLNANHPLAGKDLTFAIELVAIV